MAKVSITPIVPGDARGAGAFNTILGALQTQSTNIDGANLREEGFDRESLDPPIAYGTPFTAVTAVGPTYRAYGAFTLLNIAATDLTSGGFTLGANVGLLVEVFLNTQNNTERTDVRLLYKLSTGADTVVAESLRSRGAGGAGEGDFHAMAWFAPTGSSRTFDYVRVQAFVASAGNAYFGYALLRGRLYRKA